MDETKSATQGAKTQRGGGPDKARAKQRDGVGEGDRIHPYLTRPTLPESEVYSVFGRRGIL